MTTTTITKVLVYQDNKDAPNNEVRMYSPELCLNFFIRAGAKHYSGTDLSKHTNTKKITSVYESKEAVFVYDYKQGERAKLTITATPEKLSELEKMTPW